MAEKGAESLNWKESNRSKMVQTPNTHTQMNNQNGWQKKVDNKRRAPDEREREKTKETEVIRFLVDEENEKRLRRTNTECSITRKN